MIKTLTLTIWDREFDLPIEYNCHKGMRPTKVQLDALRSFVSHTEWIEKSKAEVEAFCKEKVLEDEDNQKKDNIFSYIKPDYLLVKRDAEKPRIALMCKYRYEPEHGLAIVYSADGEIIVDIQDVIL